MGNSKKISGSSRWLKISVMIFAMIVSVPIVLTVGDIFLRNATFYGVEYFREFDRKSHILSNGKIPYIPISLKVSISEMLKNKYSRENDASIYKIMVLGDSIAAGGELNISDLAFPARLRQILTEAYPKRHFDIFTFAVGGFSTEEEVAGYEKYGTAYSPDLVILAYCYNDTVEVFPRIKTKDGKSVLAYYKTAFTYFGRVPFSYSLSRRFLTVRLLNELIEKFSASRKIPLGMRTCELGAGKVYQALAQLRLLTKHKNVPVVIAVFPRLQDPASENDMIMPKAINEWCREFEFFHIDIGEAYNKYDYAKLRCVQTDTCHPNVLGHELAAGLIAEKIRQYGLVL